MAQALVDTLADAGTTPVRCIVVDDDLQVRRAVARMVESLGLACREASDGQAALDLLDTLGEVPLVISDIQMPGMDGIALLRSLRQRLPDTVVIMLSGLAEVQTAVDCLQHGALDYLSKPVQLDELRARVAQAMEKRELRLQNRYYQLQLETRVRELTARNRELFVEQIQLAVRLLEARDAYTRGHSQRVARYAVGAAVRLGLTDERLEQVRLGGELHDIGKIGTADHILHKPGPLTDEEFAQIKRHTVDGERILAPLFRDRPAVMQIVRSHHERMDGRGFPDGLPGDRIPLEARIVGVADAFDAMTTNRAYREARQPAEAMQELRRFIGTQFDPAVVEAFLAAFPDPAVLPIAATT
jgi:response regulator RpfG family c-di-GMP phosphodiesterase